MLEARALFYAIIVSLLIAVVSGALVSLAYLQRLQQTDQFQQQRMVRNVKSGIELVKGKGVLSAYEDIDLYGNQTDSITVGQLDWGLFKVGFSQAISRSLGQADTLTKVFYLGEQNNPSLAPALFLTDHSTDLSIAGNTLLKGAAFVPHGAIKLGTANLPYTGSSIAKVAATDSPRQLPLVDQERIKSLYTYFQKRPKTSVIPKEWNQSFLEPTLLLGGRYTEIAKVRLRGNIIIIAKDSVFVQASADLEDVLIFAPKIMIAAGFKGQIQAFASRELIVQEDCELRYPSIVGLLRGAHEKEKPRLTIEGRTQLQGLVFAYQPKHFRKLAYLKIAKEARVEGQIFADAEVDLRGIVQGNLTCRALWRSSSMLQVRNLLLDATIDRSQLSEYFASPFITASINHPTIVKWME